MTMPTRAPWVSNASSWSALTVTPSRGLEGGNGIGKSPSAPKAMILGTSGMTKHVQFSIAFPSPSTQRQSWSPA
jgi:hypothetical protein